MACLEIISNTNANFLNLHINKARKTHDDKQLYWQQMIIKDNFLYWDIYNNFIYLVTLKVTLQLFKSPKDKNEELLFSKLQFNSFSLITTVSCSESTLLVYGFRPKIALMCEITFKNASHPFVFVLHRLWNCINTTHLSSSSMVFSCRNRCSAICEHNVLPQNSQRK